MSEKQLSVRLPEREMELLERYAEKAKRTKTDVIREFIRTLEGKPPQKGRVLDPVF